MNPNKFLGVNKDTRTPEQLESVVRHNEIVVGSSVPNYLASAAEASKYVDFFPVMNQLQTSSCMAHGHSLTAVIYRFLKYQLPAEMPAPIFTYRQRVNYPAPGMEEGDVEALIMHSGILPFAELPTPATEDAANAVVITDTMKKDAKNFLASSWVELRDPPTIDTLALISNDMGLPIAILIYATVEEWSAADVTILTPGLKQGDPEAIVEHCITVLPFSGFIDPVTNKKKIIIQDSAFFGGLHTRTVDEDFIAQRCFAYAYIVGLTAVGNQTKPASHTFKNSLNIGSTGQDVTALQQWLQFMGFMPTHANGNLLPLGYYGGITKQAVLAFQNAYPEQILGPAGLSVGTGNFGPMTMKYLNTITN